MISFILVLIISEVIGITIMGKEILKIIDKE